MKVHNSIIVGLEEQATRIHWQGIYATLPNSLVLALFQYKGRAE